MINAPIHLISSMATRQMLSDLAPAWERRSGYRVHVESIGGVEAVKRVQRGESFDIAVLAADAIDSLAASGHVACSSVVAVARSGVAVAVRAGTPKPEIASEEALRLAVLAASTVGYSTGPSGTALTALFARWSIAGEIQERLVQAPSGVPVGSLVASGEVALGFQQLSELMHLEGVDVVGPLPDAIQITTTFSAALVANSKRREAVSGLLSFLASAETAETKRRHGMAPA